MGPELPPVTAVTTAAPTRPQMDTNAPEKWLGRLTLGVGSARPSQQETVLDLDGYGSARYLLGIEVGAFLTKDVVLAGFALSSGRSDSSRYGGPALREESYSLGVALPLIARLPFSNVAVLSPRVGVGLGSQSFHGQSKFAAGAGFGAEVALLVLRAHIGIGLGFWSLRVPGQAGLSLANDFGSSYLMLSGMVGG